MTIAKMALATITLPLEQVDGVLLDLAHSGLLIGVDAMMQIENNNFLYPADEHNIDHAVDFNSVSPYGDDEEAKILLDELSKITEGVEPATQTTGVDLEGIKSLVRTYRAIDEDVSIVVERLSEVERYLNRLDLLENNAITPQDFMNLAYFDYRFGRLDAEGRLRLKRLYETIPSVVLHIGRESDDEVYLLVHPKNLSEEIGRILRNLKWVDLELPLVEEDRQTLERERQMLAESIDAYNKAFLDFRTLHQEGIQGAANGLPALRKVASYKKQMAKSEHYAYLAGWVAQKDVNALETLLGEGEGVVVSVRGSEALEIVPPTRMENHRFFKPFELLVVMYGTPNYVEIDPTPFFAITYLLLFGAMFGDLGQGAIFLLAGLGVRHKINSQFGALIAMLGASSMVFGILYGSVFGMEHWIPALLIRPFDNINTMLIAAIAFGVALTAIAYVMGIVNALRRNDREEALFGKEGVAGFALFGAFILLVLRVLGIIPIPTVVLSIAIALCIGAIVFKQPLMALLEQRKPLHDEEVGAYYIEGGFSIIETLLSIFSGTISFIRVGAFAINHVGLFLAFQTMAKMIGTQPGSTVILILGNLLIILLEGLIVFIQGLRLEYYELFSKYYTGDGYVIEDH